MLEPGLSDHSFASLLADPSSAMLTGDSPRITNGKKEESELMNGCDVARGGSRGGVSEGSGCGRDMSEHTTQQQHHHHQQQSGPHLPPPPLLPAATTTNGGDKCEGSATPYALPSAPYTLPANPPVLFPPSVFPPHPQQHTSEPREVFSAPFPALTFPLQNGMPLDLLVVEPFLGGGFHGLVVVVVVVVVGGRGAEGTFAEGCWIK
ncbi:hypothetical protein Pcinc_039187 [Petrolisthes cinctipes]|uniref:Uncharacterized protein n=1 Tax=Petrolisthes cinctipes TaxID=88211 RepID=A0AAE1BPW8_PETCI|nr:hypothetical protein Pcinc_039187 [Petrolisthes cinctipes]